MSYHKLNPLEKEYLIKQYRARPGVRMADFCERHQVVVSAFQEWLKHYDAEGFIAEYIGWYNAERLCYALDFGTPTLQWC